MSDIVDRAAGAVRATPVPDVPADLLAATVAAVQTRVPLADRRARRRRIMRYAGATGLVAAASVAVGLLWAGSGTAQASLRKAIENQEKAKTFRAVTRVTFVNPPPGTPPMPESRMYGQGAKLRIEVGTDAVTVGDGEAKKLLILDHKNKIARTMSTEVPGEMATAVAKWVKRMLDKEGAEDLGESFLDGRKVHGYRFTKMKIDDNATADVTYYVDPKRNLPVRVEMAMAGGPLPAGLTSRIDYLGFDEELDPKLFDLTPPAGYKVEAIDPSKLPGAGPKK